MRDDDGIWMFALQFQGDVKSGIDRAISELQRQGKQAHAVGYYSNKINERWKEIQPYMEASYRTPSGHPLGSSGRRELIKAICLNLDARIEDLLEEILL